MDSTGFFSRRFKGQLKAAGIYHYNIMQRQNMFYGAPPHIFEKARDLRKLMTPAEQMLWGHLKKRKLKGYKFRRQHPISEFIVDFYCHSAKLAIEADGGIHNLKDQNFYDIKRSEELNRFGIKVIRFTNEQIEEDIEGVTERIGACLDASENP